MGELSDRLEHEAIVWRPDKTADLGQYETNEAVIEGTVAGTTEGVSDYGPHKILELVDVDGFEEPAQMLRVHMLGQILEQEYTRRDLGRPGTRVAIKYLGKAKSNDGKRDYNSYRVAHTPPAGAPQPVTTPAAPAPAPPDDFEPF